MKFAEQITVGQLLQLVRDKHDEGHRYCVYGRGDSDTADLDSVCFVAAHPELTDDDDEIPPAFVTENSLELWFRDENVQDVVTNALHQETNASDETILAALKHYLARDAFLVIT